MNDTYNFYQTGTIDNSLQMPDIEPGKDYCPSDALIEAVNVAILLQKPLLVTGAPGTGKTELAYHLAQKFTSGQIEIFTTRTDSVAADLLYRYDGLAHFQKANLSKNDGNELDINAVKQFITPVALGKAICESKDKRLVVLIDEIDKAPRDLPNDILSVIERMEYEIPELKGIKGANETHWKKTGCKEMKPIVILTSNSEKTLPEAFLRRCVFFHIEIPGKDLLCKILLGKRQLFPNLTKEKANEFIELFNILKTKIRGKEPATHELILWVWWMLKNNFEPSAIYQFKDTDTNKAINQRLLAGTGILAKETDDWKNLMTAVKTGITSGGK